jgi:hypothetical protein
MFCFFTGTAKYQARAWPSGFDPLSRTCRFG